MPLQQGEVRGYDFNRSVVEFTMLNQGRVILCPISIAAMDDLEGKSDVRPDQRVDQFMRLSALAEAGLPVICVETRHMRAVLKAQINKTDRNDARGMAQMMRAGLY